MAATFTAAVVADRETTEAIFARFNEMGIAIAVMIAEIRKQDVSKAVLESLTVLQSGIDEIKGILLGGG